MNNNIKTIIFDLGGVIMDLDQNACIEAFKNIGIHDIEQYIGTYVQQGVFLQMEEGKIGEQVLYEEVRKISSNKNITNEQIRDAWCKFIVDIPEYRLNLLLELRKKYQVFMLSNTNSIVSSYYTQHLFTKQGLTIDDYFDRRYLSYQMGYVKPAPEIFQMLITDSGIHPQEALFLDDGKKNIVVAQQLGFQTHWVKPNEDLKLIFQ